MRGDKGLVTAESPTPIFPEELLWEILSRLPVRSLIRFRCVCKSWNSLVSDRRFVKKHLERSSAGNGDFSLLRFMFHSSSSCTVSSFLKNPLSVEALPPHSHFPSHLINRGFGVRGSCDGMVCLSVSDIKTRTNWVHLWNPSTGTMSQESPPLFRESHHDSICYGFGYDRLSDIYKVVAMFYSVYTKETSQVKVYSVGSNFWRSVSSFPAAVLIGDRWRRDGVYLCGFVNWIGLLPGSMISANDFSYSSTDSFVIVSLDLGKEKYTQLLLPHVPDEGARFALDLGVLRGHLCVYQDYDRSRLVIWQMNNFGLDNSWTPLVNLNYDHLYTHFRDYRSPILPVCMSEGDNVLMFSQSEIAGESLAVVYNRRDNRLESFATADGLCFYTAKLYVESLVLPH